MATFQAIVTKYLPATNLKGSRVKASARAGSVILSWDDALDTEENHVKAALALAVKFGWAGEWYGAALPNDKGNCYACADIGQGPTFTSVAFQVFSKIGI